MTQLSPLSVPLRADRGGKGLVQDSVKVSDTEAG